MPLCNVHWAPAATVDARKRLIDVVWAHFEPSRRCLCGALGDMSFVHSDGHRVDIPRLERVPTADLDVSYFERRMQGCDECEQMGYTRSRFDEGTPILISRIDHKCAQVPPTDLDSMSIMAGTVGELLRWDAPSDHVAVSVRIARKRRRFVLGRCIGSYAGPASVSQDFRRAGSWPSRCRRLGGYSSVIGAQVSLIGLCRRRRSSIFSLARSSLGQWTR